MSAIERLEIPADIWDACVAIKNEPHVHPLVVRAFNNAVSSGAIYKAPEVEETAAEGELE